jgi:hypothetical protein
LTELLYFVTVALTGLSTQTLLDAFASACVDAA